MSHNQSGQVGIWTIVSVGAAAILAISGSLLGVSNIFSSKVDAVRTEVNTFKVEIGKEISTLNAESTQYRKDIDSINKKLDEIIKILK